MSKLQRHFVPGYYQPVPPGQEPSPIKRLRIILVLHALVSKEEIRQYK